MSSGSVKDKNFNLMEKETFFDKSINFVNEDTQRKKFSLISGLMFMLFKHNNNQETIKNISNFIVLALKTKNNNLSDNLDGDFDDYLALLKEIRAILLNNPKFTNKQKFECCSIERYFMKMYLKEFLVKLNY